MKIEKIQEIIDKKVKDPLKKQVAMNIARNIINKGKGGRGYSTETVTAAIIYLASKKINKPMGLMEVSDLTNIESKEIGRKYKKLKKKLGMKYCQPGKQSMVSTKCVAFSRVEQYLPLAKSILTEKEEKQAKELINEMEQKGMTQGKNPLTLCAGVVYYIKEGINTQREIADLFKITEVSIRNRVREIKKYKSKLTKLKEEKN